MRHSQLLRSPKRHEHYTSGRPLSSVKLTAMAKRTLQINVRMASEDLALLQKGAAALWPGLDLTTSTIVLSLAKKAAEEALRAKEKGKR